MKISWLKEMKNSLTYKLERNTIQTDCERTQAKMSADSFLRSFLFK